TNKDATIDSQRIDEMKYRKLRIAWSVAWGVVAVLIVRLWVWTINELHYYDWIVTNTSNVIQVISYGGKLWVNHGSWTLPLLPDRTFGWSFDRDGQAIVTPHWLVALFLCAFAGAPWISILRFRFSLRTLLIATALAAIVLWLVVWAAR